MAKVLRCGDIVGGCPEVFRAETEEEIMQVGGRHAKEAHGFDTDNTPPEILQQVRGLIRDE